MVKQTKESTLDSNSLVVTSFRKIKPTPRSFASLKVYQNKEPHRHHQRTLLLKEGKAEHIAKNFGDQASQKLVKYVVAIKDTKTDQLQFIETKDIFDISFRVAQSVDKFEISQPFYDPQYKRRLVQEFGTNKSKRKINQMMSNIIK